MSLPPLATIEDVTALAPELADLDEGQVGRLLILASAHVRVEAGKDWTNAAGDALLGVPDGIPELVANVVIRTLKAPDPGLTQQTVGPWTESYERNAAADGVFLKPGEREFVRAVARGGRSRAFSISTHGEPGYLG